MSNINNNDTSQNYIKRKMYKNELAVFGRYTQDLATQHDNEIVSQAHNVKERGGSDDDEEEEDEIMIDPKHLI